MKFISWNVNGLKSRLNKGFKDFFEQQDADFFCIQDIKCDKEIFNPDKYESFYNFSNKKGYSGTAIFMKNSPLSSHFDNEGRIITLEYDYFYLVNIYIPNSKDGIMQEDYRSQWEDKFIKHISSLTKPLILCGDFNSTYLEIDRENSISKFYDENKDFICDLINDFNLKDSFRILHPDEIIYTWKSIKNNNSGSRIDYFLVSDYLIKNLKESNIYSNITGSDHFPIGIEITAI
jgi:exodeoxyribonuclease-3